MTAKYRNKLSGQSVFLFPMHGDKKKDLSLEC